MKNSFYCVQANVYKNITARENFFYALPSSAQCFSSDKSPCTMKSSIHPSMQDAADTRLCCRQLCHHSTKLSSAVKYLLKFACIQINAVFHRILHFPFVQRPQIRKIWIFFFSFIKTKSLIVKIAFLETALKYINSFNSYNF